MTETYYPCNTIQNVCAKKPKESFWVPDVLREPIDPVSSPDWKGYLKSNDVYRYDRAIELLREYYQQVTPETYKAFWEKKGVETSLRNYNYRDLCHFVRVAQNRIYLSATYGNQEAAS